MRTGDIARQQAHYRRGLVLGFTVAECMLLILFALLLALGVVLMKRDREVQQMSTRIAQLQEADQRLQAKVDVLGALAEHKPTEQFFSELVRARQLEQQLAAEQAQLVERERAASKLEGLAQALKGSPDQRRRVAELAALGAKLEQAVAQSPGGAGASDPYDAVAKGLATVQAARDNATLRGQVVSLRSDLKKIGHGGDYPPCWVTPQGQIQYLLDIALDGPGTLTVTDATPPDRRPDRAALPLPAQLFSGPVSRAQFLALTAPLLALSNARDCRFYAIARDRTGPTQKALFKTLLIDTVESRFYKVIRQ